MKTKFSRRAKSAVSILLTLCMILSVFTIAISSASAATAEDESVGADTTYYYMGDGVDGAAWASGKEFTSLGDNFYYIEKDASGDFKITESASSYDVQYTTIDNSCGDLTLDGGGSNNITDAKDSTHYIMFFKSGNVNKIWSVSKNPSTYQYFKTWADALINGNGQESRYGKVFFNNAEANWTGNIYLVIGHDTWLRVHKMTALDGTDLYNYNLTDSGGFKGAKYYTFFSTSSELSNDYPSGTSKQKKLYELMADESDKITNVSTGYVLQSGSSVHFQNTSYIYPYKPTAAGSYQAFEFEQSTSSPGSYFNKTQTVNVYTNGASDSSGGSVSYSGYRIKSDGTSTALTSAENFPALTSEFTITATPATNFTFDGFYSDASLTQKITTGVSGNAYTYTVEDTKTVYANFVLDTPLFCLVGNDIRDDAFTINGVTPAKVTPDSDHNWFNTWQPAFAVNNTVSSGVYSITFTVKEDFQWQADVGIMNRTDGQRAFYYDGREYNTAGDNIDVPDAGISDGLYVYPLAELSPGGSLNLKKGQTYTITIDQTKRLNADAPWGKITIEAKDAYVDTVAKKIAYNPTERRYDAVSDAAKTIGTVSSEPYHGTKGNFTSTLTATKVNNNYTFTGWFTNEECTGEPVSTLATYNVENPADSVTYYALFTQTAPTTDYEVNISTPPGGVVELTGGVDSSSPAKAYPGATVGVSLNVTSCEKEFKNWKITATTTGYDVTSSVLNSGATATAASFTMPDYGVTVTAVLGDKTPVTINATSNDTSLGTAAYTPGTYYVGETISIAATNVGGVFTKWQVTGATVASATSASTTIVPTATTVTVKAIFEYKTYQLYYKGDRYLPMIRQSDGTYVSTYAIANDRDFTIYDANKTKDQYARSAADGTSWYVENTSAVKVSSWGSYEKYYHTNSLGDNRYYVKFDPSGNSGMGTVQLIADNPMGTIATIYAKDGSIRYADGGKSDGSTPGDDKGDLWEQSTGGPTCNRGTTKVTKIDNTVVKDPDTSKYPSTNPTLTDHLKQYSAPYGSTITIQTTLNDTYKDQGFEVGMFVVNGWKVAATKTSDGVYTATYTLSSDYAVNNLDGKPSFEITPVYYNSNFKYITFYVDADSVPSRWKGTISACATYANTTGAAATNAHFEGTYPGQPFGREGDLYELKVAKYYYEWAPKEAGSSEYEWKERSTYIPNATITAYNYDSVHHYYYVYADDKVNTSNNKNYQTYDYADFSYLAQIEDIEAILFRCKDTSNDNSAGLTNYNLDYDSSLTYEVLTDYYGNPIDALGNRIPNGSGGYYTAEDAASWTCNDETDVKIVSSGNAKTSALSTRTKGKWSTYWTPYYLNTNDNKHAITMKTTPADFIDVNFGKAGAAADRNIPFKYANGTSTGSGVSDLEYKRTFIAYDKERKNDSTLSGDSGNTGIRIDGQWYYSAKHEFTSNVKVAYVGENDAYVLETDTNSANNTGFIGGTSGTKATLDGNTTHTYNNVTTNATLNCTVGSGYTFVGWFIYDGTKYTKIGDNYADLNTTMLMKKNYTIVAVVKEVGSGELVITHSRYTGSKPEAHTGTGKYYVSAVINRVGVNDPIEIDEAQNSITIPSVLATDKITIKLRTVCDGADTFYAWYEEALGENYARTGNYYEICDENKDPLGESQVSYEFFQADCSTFFNGDTLTRKTLDFYSDIIHVSAYANLTYKYYDRFKENGEGNMVSYTVKNVELTPEEISNGYIPGDDKITKYAPNVVDTIYTDTKWYVVGTKVERMASNVTVVATQQDKDCFVSYIPAGEVADSLFNSKGEIAVNKVADWVNITTPFNSWIVNKDADMDRPQEDDFVISAPATVEIDDVTWNFVRFDVYEITNRTTGTIGEKLYSSNDKTFAFRIYNDSAIYPVYTNETVAKDLTANIETPVLNREIYGESATPTDRVYVDLLLSYINVNGEGKNIQVIKENVPSSSGYYVESGVIVDKTIKLSDGDYTELSEAGKARGTDNTATVIAKYTSQFNADGIDDLAKTNSIDITTYERATNLVRDTYSYGEPSVTHNLTKYINTNSKLTNKNRIDKVLTYTNNKDNQEYVYAAYSYVVVRRVSDHEIVGYAKSDAQYYNFCYLGNKPVVNES